MPDAVPRVEPRSRYGNPPFYEVFGKRYYVLSSSVGYVERGVASWYGPGLSQGANLDRRILRHVRHDGRAQDAAAARLRASHQSAERAQRRGARQRPRPLRRQSHHRPVLHGGREARHAAQRHRHGRSSQHRSSRRAARSPPRSPAPRVPRPRRDPPRDARPRPRRAGASARALGGPALFVQAGAFADPANAERLAAKLRGGGYGKVFVRDDQIAGRRMYRVRIGPVPDVAEFDRIVAALERAGVRMRILRSTSAIDVRRSVRYPRSTFHQGIHHLCFVPFWPASL